MATTTFVDQQTVIAASWLNDVNTSVYGSWAHNGSLGATTPSTVVATLINVNGIFEPPEELH